MQAFQLGKYRLIDILGTGGYGEVYLAMDTALEVERAVKVLHAPLAAAPQFIERFRREARLTARLEHPHIVPVYDLDEDQGRYFLAMAFMPGGSLKDLLARRGALPYARAVEITRQAAAALDYAAGQGLAHRDVKPGNLLFEADDNLRLADFGFARALAEGEGSTTTITMGMAGTPPYMAPEIWLEQHAGQPTDVYSLACVFYEMLTGQVLFGGEKGDKTPTPVVMKRHFDPLVLPERWPEDTPPGLEAVLRKALAKEPGERYPAAGEFAAALVELEAAAQRAAQAQAQKEAEEKARREAEERALIAAQEQEAALAAQRLAERQRVEAEVARQLAAAQALKEAAEKARREAEQQAQARKEAELAAQRESERRRLEEEVARRREAERLAAEAQALKEAAEKARREAEQRARREAQEKARLEAEMARQQANAAAAGNVAAEPRPSQKPAYWQLALGLLALALLIGLVGLGAAWAGGAFRTPTPTLWAVPATTQPAAAPAPTKPPAFTPTKTATTALTPTATFTPQPTYTAAPTETPAPAMTPTAKPATRAPTAPSKKSEQDREKPDPTERPERPTPPPP